MKSTLADNKQLFNVKAIATASLTPTQIPEGEFGIVDEATGLTVVPVDFSALPERFSIVSKLGGKVYYSFDTIEKSKIKNQKATDYKAQAVNEWRTTIESCKCIDGVQLNLNIDEASLMQRDGLTWAHKDFFIEVSPQELKCYCDCSGNNLVYENNVLTMILASKINTSESPFYEAEVRVDITGLPAGTGAPPTTGDEEQGDIYIRTAGTEGLYVYNDGSWERVGEDDGLITDVALFVEVLKAKNTNDDPDDNGPLLILVVKGKVQTAPYYNDIEVNYIYPRGVKLHPALIIDGKSSTVFTETQSLVYELGAGYDLRAEEWENFNNYTNLNYYPQLSDGVQNPAIRYQFENNANYNTLTFEFTTDKVERNNGDKRLFGILLGTTDGSVYTSLKTIFIP